MVTWRYKCTGCLRHFQGWSSSLIGTLPRSIQAVFPAVLSYRSGMSHALAQTLRVCYQHKMGAAGVKALLLELHTRRFDRLCLQYLETILEQEMQFREKLDTGSRSGSIHQSTLECTFDFKQKELNIRTDTCLFAPSDAQNPTTSYCFSGAPFILSCLQNWT
jgi:hypothetical protein